MTKVKDLQKVYDYEQVSMFDVMILLVNYLKHHEEHGNMDAIRTYEDVKKRFIKPRWIPVADLEALIYCANLLNEEGKFWHPEKMEFDPFLKRVGKTQQFDKIYNMFRGRK
jgi:hypothetical protein